MTNPRVCPHCGREDFPLASVELVEGMADIYLENNPAGNLTARWQGIGQANWDLSITTRYLCRSCGGQVSEALAVALDRLLGNTREPER